MQRSVARSKLHFFLIIFIITPFAWLSLVIIVSADESVCKLPSQTASRFCLGSDGPITVASEAEAVCIPGCTYSVKDVGDKKQISASYSEAYCMQYRSYVSYKGSGKDCYPGADAQEVTQHSSSLTSEGMSPVALETTQTSYNNSSGGTSEQKMQISPAGDLRTATQTIGDTPVGDECADGLFAWFSATCLKDTMQDFFDNSSPRVEEPTSIDELFQQVEEVGASQDDADAAATIEEVDPVVLHNTDESGAISTDSTSDRGLNEFISSPEIQVGAPVVKRIEGQHVSPQGWLEAMWQRLTVCGFSGLLSTENCRTSAGSRAVMAAAAATSPSNAEETAICKGGGDVFVYTKDLSGMSNDPNRSAELERFQCYGPHFGNATSNGRSKLEWVPLNIRARVKLKEFKTLSSEDVCKVLKGKEWNCAVMYYAVVPDLEQIRVGDADPPARVVSRQCNPQYVAQGQHIQFGMCAIAEKQIREQESQFARKSVNLNPQQNSKLFGLDWSNLNVGMTRPGGTYPNSGLPNTRGTAFTVGFTVPLSDLLK